MKTQRPQRGNPHRLTVEQHVFPARSIERFAAADGKVSVRLRHTNKQLRLRPDNSLFCAKRAWDQRAEAGYMKTIEDEFQTLADQITGGSARIDEEKSRIVSRFFALWCFRFRARHKSTPDHLVEGIAGERLSRNEEETLEAKHVGFFRSDQTMPGRAVCGLWIQMFIDKLEADFRGIRWGIASARQGELILPDTFDRFALVPVAPTTYLVCGSGDAELSLAQIVEINRLALQSARHYYVARDFARCPL